MPKVKDNDEYVDIQIGKFELFFNKNYRLLTIANELSLGLLYMIGAILFMVDATTWAMISYLLGAAQLTARPIMKLFRASYMRRVSSANYVQEDTYKEESSRRQKNSK